MSLILAGIVLTVYVVIYAFASQQPRLPKELKIQLICLRIHVFHQ
jgi:hypothetical protein